MFSYTAMWLIIFTQVDAQIDAPYYEYCFNEICYAEFIAKEVPPTIKPSIVVNPYLPHLGD